MLNLLDLIYNQLNALHEAFWIMVVQNVHIYTLATASKECFAVSIRLDTASDCCEHKSSRVNGFKVTSWHLQYHRVGRWHNRHQLCATLDTSAALVCLWLISWYFEFYQSLV